MEKKQRDLIQFLREELALPVDAIELATRQSEQNTTALPMVLWQYGLVTLAQIDQIFDWMETISS
ncbi:MAG: DUF2949 domain-containing protein [Phormidesmis sp. CAN_BIN44]|nr:DUF2949 domain-containing protein [Phormidesmis sp. CAN_BIN44]